MAPELAIHGNAFKGTLSDLVNDESLLPYCGLLGFALPREYSFMLDEQLHSQIEVT